MCKRNGGALFFQTIQSTGSLISIKSLYNVSTTLDELDGMRIRRMCVVGMYSRIKTTPS